jgi:hypothetical protein
MSRKPAFANLRTASAAPVASSGEGEATSAAATPTQPRTPGRVGRKQIAGFFPPEMSLALHMLALRQDRSLQSLMSEAFNDVLRKYGESPVGD